MGYIYPQEEFLANYAAFSANLPKWHVMDNYYRNIERSTITYLLEDQNRSQLVNTYNAQLTNIINAVPKDKNVPNVLLDIVGMSRRGNPYVFVYQTANDALIGNYTLSGAYNDLLIQFRQARQNQTNAFANGNDAAGWEYSRQADEIGKQMAQIVDEINRNKR